jgi:hypothetical protein
LYDPKDSATARVIDVDPAEHRIEWRSLCLRLTDAIACINRIGHADNDIVRLKDPLDTPCNVLVVYDEDPKCGREVIFRRRNGH